MVGLTFLTRAGCHLCETAQATIAEVVVRQPSYLQHLSGVLEATPVEAWRDWFLSPASPALAAALRRATANYAEVCLSGFSMGGYGAIISAGGGVTDKSIGYEWGAPDGLLGMHKAGSAEHEALIDPRLKAIVAIGPWGRNRDFWDAEGLSGVRVPALYVAGSVDDVSQYETGIRKIWEESSGTDRHLLTFISANHNAAAPMPAPMESYPFSDELGWAPFEHYADAVWDTVRMNNIMQHFATAFMDLHLKNDTDKAVYLDLVETAEDGVFARNDDGTDKPEHTYWRGFPDRSAKGLMFETRSKGE